MKRPVKLAGLGGSLAINAYQTLKLLKLITIIGDDYDALCWPSRELGFIAGNNILEELELVVVPGNGTYSSVPEYDDWSALDLVLTESRAFPMLRRVSVKIPWYSTCMDLSEHIATLKSLKKKKFPRLVESKAVKFNFCAEICYSSG